MENGTGAALGCAFLFFGRDYFRAGSLTDGSRLDDTSEILRFAQDDKLQE